MRTSTECPAMKVWHEVHLAAAPAAPTSVFPSAVSFRPGVSSYWDITLGVEAEMFVCVTGCLLHDICKYVIWWWCMRGWMGRGFHQQPKMGRARLLQELGMGEGQCSILRIMQVLWKVAFTQEKGPRKFIYLCCCFVGKKTPDSTNNNHQGFRDVKLRNQSVLMGFSRYILMLLCSQSGCKPAWNYMN